MNNNDYDDWDLDDDYDWLYDENLESSKTKDKVKWIATAVAFALIAIMLIITCLQVFGNGNVKPSEWFGNDEQAGTSDGLILTESENKNGVSLGIVKAALNSEKEISAQSGNVYTVTATTKPVAANATFAWDIRWSEPDSSWAESHIVSDYLKLTTKSNTVTVECLDAFGAQATLTVTVNDSESLRASCTVDYKQKYLGTSTALTGGYALENNFSTDRGVGYKTLTLGSEILGGAGKTSPTFAACAFKPVLSEVYTIPLETSATFTYYIAASPELANNIALYNQHMSGCSLTVANGYKKFASATANNVSESKTVQMDRPDGYEGIYISAMFAAICPETEKSKGTFSDEQYPFLLKAMDGLSNNPGLTGENKYHFTVKVEAIVNGRTYTDIEKLYCGACTVIVTSVGIDADSIEF